VLEYGIALAEGVTPGIVIDTLRGLPTGDVRNVEMKK